MLKLQLSGELSSSPCWADGYPGLLPGEHQPSCCCVSPSPGAGSVHLGPAVTLPLFLIPYLRQLQDPPRPVFCLLPKLLGPFPQLLPHHPAWFGFHTDSDLNSFTTG